MYNLMKLELRKNKMTNYIISGVIITVIMLSLLYLFAYMPRFEDADPDLAMFGNYPSLISLTGSLNMACFSILSSVMYSKILVEDYNGKNVVLLFSYPIDRKTLYMAKVLVVVLFTFTAALASNLLIFTVLAITETVSPLINDKFMLDTAGILLRRSFFMAALSTGIGSLSMFVGFRKKSIQVTIITALLLCSFLTNLVASSGDHEVGILVPSIIVVVISVLLVNVLGERIKSMEVF